MKKTLITLMFLSSVSFATASAQYVPVSVTPQAKSNAQFYAPLFNLSLEDMASLILSQFSVPYKTVAWVPAYITSPNVQIAVIRKISDTPQTYTLVRFLATSTPNTGTFAYFASSTDSGADRYIQVGCTLTSFACQAFSLIPNP